MDSIYVRGGIGLCGKVKIQGSKNAALPILAATILTEDRVVIQNCPKISDVYGMVRILESLGCKARWEKDALALQTDVLLDGKLPREDMGSMRSSIFLLGSLLGRTGHAELTAPGGCVIGKRPIDIHIQALEQMGVSFWEEAEILHARADAGIHGCDVTLASPSVGATENVVLCAVTAEGSTILRGAAREPEVQELCRFLNALGARIEGIGETVLTIEGVQRLKGATHRIPADRIVAGTYLLSGFVTGGGDRHGAENGSQCHGYGGRHIYSISPAGRGYALPGNSCLSGVSDGSAVRASGGAMHRGGKHDSSGEYI